MMVRPTIYGILISVLLSFLCAAESSALSFYDDFGTNRISEYTVTQTWTQGGTGRFVYDSAGQRAQAQAGDNIGIKFAHTVAPLAEGSFSLDFLPTIKYPFGGILFVRLAQDQQNYYELSITDGYEPGYVKKVVNGREVARALFQRGFIQNARYTLTITYSAGATKAEALGQILNLNADATGITVNWFEVEVQQQYAYFDNISLSSMSPAPGNMLPTAAIDSISPNPGQAGSSVSFAGHGTDSDGTVTAYLWTSSLDGQLSTAAAFSTARLSAGSHTISLKVQDNAGSWSTETSRSLTVNQPDGVAPTIGFVDDFSTNSSGEYSVAITKAHTGQTVVPRGEFTYETPNRRVKVLAAENTRVLFSHPLASQANGAFLLDFLPTYKHTTPLVAGGRLLIRLKQDQANYYELYSSNGAGAGYIRKIVNGQQAAYTAFRTGYLLNNKTYTIKITYAAGTAKVEAFDQVLTITAGGVVMVNSFEVEAVQQDAYFDNIISPHTTEPYVFIANPRKYYLQKAAPLTVKGLSGNVQAGWGTRFVLDKGTAGELILTDMTAPYEVSFGSVALGEHTIDAFVVDASGNAVPGDFTRDSQPNIGIGAYIVAIGDSITYGDADNDPFDNASDDERDVGGGYEPILNNFLTDHRRYPHTIANEGVNGARTVNGMVFVPSVLAQHPNASHYLVMYGTNDSRLKTPSGLGLRSGDPGYAASYKYYLQAIITSIKKAGKIPVLAKIPPVLGDSATGSRYPDFNSASRNVLIRDYNRVIDELVAENSLLIRGPDFYQYFSGHTEEYFDNYHPNGKGYQSMAHLWFNALIQ